MLLTVATRVQVHTTQLFKHSVPLEYVLLGVEGSSTRIVGYDPLLRALRVSGGGGSGGSDERKGTGSTVLDHVTALCLTRDSRSEVINIVSNKCPPLAIQSC